MKSSNCFVANIDVKLADKLRIDLEHQGFSLSTPQYTIFSAQKKGVSCTLYASGKLTVQGKLMREFIEFYLEPEILGALSYTYKKELALESVDLQGRIGVDEAGKGDFFGPLCIAGVKAEGVEIQKLIEIGVKDSKKMSDGAMIKMASLIKESCPHVFVSIFPKKYNELYASFHNLNRLLAWGHATAIEQLQAKTGCSRALIDQFAKAPLVGQALKQKKITIELEERTHAEADPVVAAASILARVAFVQGLEKLSKEVGMELPKGASFQVLEAGRKLVDQKGEAILSDIAKTHFKTYNEILRK